MSTFTFCFHGGSREKKLKVGMNIMEYRVSVQFLIMGTVSVICLNADHWRIESVLAIKLIKTDQPI